MNNVIEQVLQQLEQLQYRVEELEKENMKTAAEKEELQKLVEDLELENRMLKEKIARYEEILNVGEGKTASYNAPKPTSNHPAGDIPVLRDPNEADALTKLIKAAHETFEN